METKKMSNGVETKKPIVLIVEDEKPLQEAIKIKLEKNGFDPVTARSVDQGINFLKDIKAIDIIWLDHYLFGKKNGLDFVAKIKENAKWKNIPVFVVSNTASDDKVRSYLALGVEKYYIKANYRLDSIISDIQLSIKENL